MAPIIISPHQPLPFFKFLPSALIQQLFQSRFTVILYAFLCCSLAARLCAFSTESFTFTFCLLTPKREANSCYECISHLLWFCALWPAGVQRPGCGTSFPSPPSKTQPLACLQLRATPLRLCHTARAKEPYSSLCTFERSDFPMSDLTEGLSTAAGAFSHSFIDAN